MLKVLRQVVGVRHPASKPFKKTLYTDRHAEYVILDSSLCACDGLFSLLVEEKAISWTWCAFAMAFSPCLSRKR